MTFARPVSVLCDMHAIPILMYLSEHGPSVRTDIYSAVGRSAKVPKKLERMEDAGMIRTDDAGRARLMSLMDMEEDVAGRLGDIDEPMSGQ